MPSLKENVKSSHFIVLMDNNLTDNDRKVLNYLYLPLIGDKALSIFNLLSTKVEAYGNESNVLNHEQLLIILNISGNKFVEERKKLEAVGLLDTYYKEQTYVYVLKRVLTGFEFFNDEGLVKALSYKLGDEETDKLAYEFLLRRIDVNNFEKISASFNDVFDIVDDYDKSYYRLGIDSRNNGIVLSKTAFDLEKCMLLVESRGLVNKATLDSDEFFDNIIRYSYFYGLDEVEMERVITSCIDGNGGVDYSNMTFFAKKIYDEKHHDKKLVEKTGVVRSSDEKIRALEDNSPNVICKTVFKTELTSGEIDMFDRLSKETGVGIGVINVLLIYVIKEKNGQIPTYNYFLKILNEWLRAGVKSTSDAVSYINGTFGKNVSTRSPRQNKKVNPVPDWYKKPTEEVKSDKPEDNSNEELIVDLEEFFKKGK